MCALQIDTAERGFSFARDGPLDMRMDPSAQHSAEEIVNTWPEADLGRIFREWGEERAWRSLASKIVQVLFLLLPSPSCYVISTLLVEVLHQANVSLLLLPSFKLSCAS